MLGKTAGGLFWMFRYLERSENIARLVEAGFRIALTRAQSAESEWASVVATAGAGETYSSIHSNYEGGKVIDFLLRDSANPSSVISVMKSARENARLSRTALTREVWEAVNESWITMCDQLAKPVQHKDLPDILSMIRKQSAHVQGALHGTMLRNDIYDFARLGTFIERADNTARILDVKYYVLLPSLSSVGSPLDNVQWETILRSVSAERAYRWHHRDEIKPTGIAKFLILDKSMPRSLAFCVNEIVNNLSHLNVAYNTVMPSYDMAYELLADLNQDPIEQIFEKGLHETINKFLDSNNSLAQQIETDYRFTA